ncbi:MAG: SRPBCC domain-containing protein [Phycisphaerales bacterium]
MMETLYKTKEMTITRIFNAPVDIVWRAWSKPEIIQKWWGPKNFTAPHYIMDFRVGGKYLSCMRSPEGVDYWSTGVYKEIEPLKRIVCTDSFSNNEGKIISAALYGMNPDFPPEMQINLEFEDLNGKTKMTLVHEGLPESEQQMCSQGWNESFDKLDELLNT